MKETDDKYFQYAFLVCQKIMDSTKAKKNNKQKNAIE